MSNNTDLKNNSVIDLKNISNNYNQQKILNLIRIIHKKRVLIHIKKFLIWMI
jgi:hypothetical protein